MIRWRRDGAWDWIGSTRLGKDIAEVTARRFGQPMRWRCGAARGIAFTLAAAKRAAEDAYLKQIDSL